MTRGEPGNYKPKATVKRREQVSNATTIARMRKKTRLFQDMRTLSTMEKEAAATQMEAALDFIMATTRRLTMEDILSNRAGTPESRLSLETRNDISS